MIDGFVMCVAVMVLVLRIACKTLLRAVDETDKAEGRPMLPPEDQTELDTANAMDRIYHQTFVMLDSHRIVPQTRGDSDGASWDNRGHSN